MYYVCFYCGPACLCSSCSSEAETHFPDKAFSVPIGLDLFPLGALLESERTRSWAKTFPHRAAGLMLCNRLMNLTIQQNPRVDLRPLQIKRIIQRNGSFSQGRYKTDRIQIVPSHPETTQHLLCRGNTHKL